MSGETPPRTAARFTAPRGLTAIAIATQRRPQALHRLLQALADDYGSRSDVSIVVIDNDPQGSAREIVESMRARFLHRVIYRIEPREGYASARNAAVAEAADADYVAFIDDDELPEPDWLDHLHDTRRRFDADIVAGVVLADLPPGVPAWIRASGVMSSEQPSLATGTAMMWCAAGNTLVTYRVFEKLPGGFDRRYDATGGEDTDFFARSHVAGFRIVWSNEARVLELIPIDRTRVAWILRRAARTGNNKALIAVWALRSPTVIGSRIAKAAAMLALGPIMAAVGVCRRDRGMALRGLQRCAEGAGTFVGFLGIRLA